MKLILLSLTFLFITHKMSFGQAEWESELHRIVNQNKSTKNIYIDSLFRFADSANDETLTNKVDKVSNRRELLYITRNYEKVAYVYEDGKPIVKSIKNRITGITYWNQFHANGKLKLTGYSSGLLDIGNWEEYDENGKLKGVIDREANRVNFETIYKRAADLGISRHDNDFIYSSDDKVWVIKDWTTKKKFIFDDNSHVRTDTLN